MSVLDETISAPDLIAMSDDDPRLHTEDVHTWFGLSYAGYAVLPRTVLQSLSPALQTRFVALMHEIQAEIDYDDPPGGYRVIALDANGRFTRDPLADYERGRRKIPRRALRDIAIGECKRVQRVDVDPEMLSYQVHEGEQ